MWGCRIWRTILTIRLSDSENDFQDPEIEDAPREGSKAPYFEWSESSELESSQQGPMKRQRTGRVADQAASRGEGASKSSAAQKKRSKRDIDNDYSSEEDSGAMEEDHSMSRVIFEPLPEKLAKFGTWRSNVIEDLKGLKGRMPQRAVANLTKAMGPKHAEWVREEHREKLYRDPVGVIRKEVSRRIINPFDVMKLVGELCKESMTCSAQRRVEILEELQSLRKTVRGDPREPDFWFMPIMFQVAGQESAQKVLANGTAHSRSELYAALLRTLEAQRDAPPAVEPTVTMVHRKHVGAPKRGRDDESYRRRGGAESNAAYYRRIIDDLPAEQRERRRNAKCFKCGALGHIRADCLEKNSNAYMLHQVNGDVDMVFRLDVGGVEMSCLYDTGAGVSLIRNTALEKRGIRVLGSIPGFDGPQISSATGESLKIVGTVRLEITGAGGFKFSPTLLVVENLNPDAQFDVIIGADVIMRFGLQLMVRTRTLTIATAIAKPQVADGDVRRIAAKYPGVLVEELGMDVGRADVEEVVLNVDPTERPHYSRNYRMSKEQLTTVEEEVLKMLENGVIEECKPNSSSKGWNSPILLVPKKDGSWRFCIDFRKLNAATWKVNAPLPRISELLEEAAGAKIFSKMDLASGYWQIPVSKQSRGFLAFESGKRQYQFKVMPFGISNAPAIFQRLIDSLVGDIPGVSGYIDDIVIYSKDRASHLKAIEEVFKRLKRFRLKANVRKCEFCLPSVEAFGFTISAGKVTPSEKRAEALARLVKPENEKQVQKFLGMANYYRGLIGHFADHEEPLRKFCKTAEWTPDCDKAYDALVRKLGELPAVYPNYLENTTLEVHTDASNVAVAGVLMQKRRDNTTYPVAFFSRILKEPAERNYSATEKELLAVHNSLMYFRHYIGAKKVLVKTDHRPLLGILQTKESPFGARWSRRIFQLAEFNYEVQYVEGTRNVVPDYLSRMVHVIRVEWESLAEMQRLDREVVKIRDSHPDALLEAGIVYVVGEDGALQVVLPRALQREAMAEAHGEGHFGLKKSLHRVRQNFFWPGMAKDVEQFVHDCGTCAVKQTGRRPVGELQHIEKGGVWESLAMDHFGPFRVGTNDKKAWVILVVDLFTKYAEAKLVSDVGSAHVVLFLQEIFARHGYPKSVLTDNGAAFVSEAVRQVYENGGVKGKHSTPYNPQGNGVVERLVRTIKEGMRSVTQSELQAGATLLQVVHAYNSSVHASTGFAPFYLMYHRHRLGPLASAIQPTSSTTLRQLVENGKKIAREATRLAKDQITQAERAQDAYLEKKHAVLKEQFQIGDRVWIRDPRTSRTFEPEFKNLARIVALPSKNYCAVRDEQTQKDRLVNVRHLVKWRPKPRESLIDLDEGQAIVANDSRNIGQAIETSEERRFGGSYYPDDDSEEEEEDGRMERNRKNRVDRARNNETGVVSDSDGRRRVRLVEPSTTGRTGETQRQVVDRREPSGVMSDTGRRRIQRLVAQRTTGNTGELQRQRIERREPSGEVIPEPQLRDDDDEPHPRVDEGARNLVSARDRLKTLVEAGDRQVSASAGKALDAWRTYDERTKTFKKGTKRDIESYVDAVARGDRKSRMTELYLTPLQGNESVADRFNKIADFLAPQD